jgi:hypothetical protein
MKKLKLFVLLLILFFCTPLYAANVVAIGANCVTITGLDEDWDWGDTYNYPLDIWCIVFYPSATDDRMIVHNGDIDDEEFFDSDKVADEYDTRVIYFPPNSIVPVIDISDCTLGTAASAKVKIIFR